jgi:hypothetical protein
VSGFGEYAVVVRPDAPLTIEMLMGDPPPDPPGDGATGESDDEPQATANTLSASVDRNRGIRMRMQMISFVCAMRKATATTQQRQIA